jgi:hypothetical protein
LLLCENLPISIRETNGPSVARRGEGDLGPFQRAAGLGEDANCPLPIHLRSGDETSKM